MKARGDDKNLLGGRRERRALTQTLIPGEQKPRQLCLCIVSKPMVLSFPYLTTLDMLSRLFAS